MSIKVASGVEVGHSSDKSPNHESKATKPDPQAPWPLRIIPHHQPFAFSFRTPLGVRSTYLLDDVLSCDILDDSCRGGTWSRVPGRTHGWFAHWADCSREICHCKPCLPRSRPLYRGRCSLPLDWNSCHNCLVQDVKSRDQLDTKMGSAVMQGPCTTHSESIPKVPLLSEPEAHHALECTLYLLYLYHVHNVLHLSSYFISIC